MRYDDERPLAQDIKTQLLKPVYLLTGDEGYLKTAYKSRLVAAVTGGQATELNLAVFSAEGTHMGELMGAVTTLPFLGGRRCVVVEDFFPERLTEGDIALWGELLSQIPPETVLVLIAPAPPEKSKTKAAEPLYRLIDTAGGAVVSLNGRRGGDLVRFVARRCETEGATISTEAARHLIERVGEDMAALESECKKLSAYAGGGEITAAMIDSLSPASLEADIFQLSRHLISGDLTKALGILGTLWDMRTPPGLIIATLGGSLGDLYKAKCGQQKGIAESQIASDFGYRHAFRVKNALRDSRPLKPIHIAGAMAAVLEADRLMKTTPEDSRVLIERGLVRASAALRGKDYP